MKPKPNRLLRATLLTVVCWGVVWCSRDVFTAQRVINVAAGGDLQAAIDTAQSGDTIIVEAGATYAGPFYLPNKTGTGYITIKSSALASLPVGVRVSPASARHMPKLVSAGSGTHGANGQPVIWTLASAHHWKFQGLEMQPAPGESTSLSILLLESQSGQGPGNASTIPHHISVDRCYIHGTDENTTAVRGIALNSTDSEVIDSYISNIHGQSTDSQAIFAWNTPGNLVIRNNYLEAASECLQIGNGDAGGVTPNNVTIAQNHISRPLAWRARDNYRNVKNLFETKGCTNCLIDGNLMENNWADGQVGYAVVISAWYNSIRDLTFSNNLIRHVGAGVSVSDHGLSGTCTNVTIKNNLIEDLSPTVYNNPVTGGLSAGNFLAMGPSGDITFDHNTSVAGGVSIDGNSFATSPNFVFKNSIIGYPAMGWAIMKTVPASGGTLTKNVVIGVGGHSGLTDIFGYQDYAPQGSIPAYPQSSLYPSIAGTMLWFVEDISQVRMDANYRLLAASIYKGKGTDGKDIGVDIDQLNAALGGASTPLPTPTPSPTPSPSPSPSPTPLTVDFPWPTTLTAQRALREQVKRNGWINCQIYSSKLWCERP